jgi:hypothetical protein
MWERMREPMRARLHRLLRAPMGGLIHPESIREPMRQLKRQPIRQPIRQPTRQPIREPIRRLMRGVPLPRPAGVAPIYAGLSRLRA